MGARLQPQLGRRSRWQRGKEAAWRAQVWGAVRNGMGGFGVTLGHCEHGNQQCEVCWWLARCCYLVVMVLAENALQFLP